jgi:ABC-type siderophore export system fused ATPase/permease subunit
MMRLFRTYPFITAAAITGAAAAMLLAYGIRAHLTERAADADTGAVTALAVIAGMCLVFRVAVSRLTRITHTSMAVHELERKELQEEREALQAERREMLLTLSKALGTGPIHLAPQQGQGTVRPISSRRRGGDSA